MKEGDSKVFKRILALVAMGFFIIAPAMTENSTPVVVNFSAVIQTGATITLSHNAVSWVIPPISSKAEDNTFLVQNEPAGGIQGFFSWRFIPGHRAALRFTASNFLYQGGPLDPTGMIKWSATGTLQASGTTINKVDEWMTTTPNTEIVVGVNSNGYCENLLLTYKFIQKLLMGGGTCGWQASYTVFDVV